MRLSRLACVAVHLAVLSGLLLTGARAEAQFTAQWQSAPGGGPTVLGSVAYDDKHHVYLHVWDAGNTAIGQFVASSGAILGSPFAIGTHRATFSGFPRVAYSRGTADDVFLVIYYSDVNGANVFAQRVVYTGQGAAAGALVGGFISVSPYSDTPNCVNKPNDVVYNPASQRFLISYEEYASHAGCGYGGLDTDVMVREFAADGSAVSGEINVMRGPGGQGFSALAVDWQRNVYLIAFGGDNPTVPGALGLFCRTLDGTTAQPISGLITLRDGFNDEPAITYLPERDGFLVAFTSVTNMYNVLGRFVPSTVSGPLVDPAFLAISTSGNNGGSALDYDYVSRDVLLAVMSDPKYIRGELLDAGGSPTTAAFVLNSAPFPTSGSFYPTVRPAEDGFFGMSYTVDYISARLDGFQLPAAATPGPHFGSSSPSSSIQLSVDSPINGGIYNRSFVVGGWAIDRGSSSGSGVDAVHIWAYPIVNGSPGSAIFLGGVSSFGPRPDVANAFGAQFMNSGFTINSGALPDGRYTLAIYPHSAITGQFGTPRTVTVTVASALPLMSLDTPAGGSAALKTFAVNGWAIDRFAPGGTGVDAVHVWAVPQNGAPVFLGAAALGQARQDIANAFGGQFLNSGFSLTGTLPTGRYRIVAYLHDAMTGSFNLSSFADVTIADPLMSLDTPGDNANLGQSFLIGGWAIDRGATSGTGVDGVHVWAVPVGGGAPIFVGGASPVGRPDVAAAFGDQFAGAGFGLIGALPPGTFDLVVYAHSTVTGTFNQERVVRVTIF